MKLGYYVHPSAIIDEDVKIGAGSKIWHFAQVRKDAIIGKDCNIGKDVFIDNEVKIGDGVKIQNFASIYKGIRLEDDVFIGPSVTFTNDVYPRAWIWNQKKITKTEVKKGASIGANATIIAGIVIGEYAMIGAGSVVTKTVEAHQLVYGNPAKPKGWVCKCGLNLGTVKPANFECKHQL